MDNGSEVARQQSKKFEMGKADEEWSLPEYRKNVWKYNSSDGTWLNNPGLLSLDFRNLHLHEEITSSRNADKLELFIPKGGKISTRKGSWCQRKSSHSFGRDEAFNKMAVIVEESPTCSLSWNRPPEKSSLNVNLPRAFSKGGEDKRSHAPLTTSPLRKSFQRRSRPARKPRSRCRCDIGTYFWRPCRFKYNISEAFSRYAYSASADLSGTTSSNSGFKSQSKHAGQHLARKNTGKGSTSGNNYKQRNTIMPKHGLCMVGDDGLEVAGTAATPRWSDKDKTMKGSDWWTKGDKRSEGSSLPLLSRNGRRDGEEQENGKNNRLEIMVRLPRNSSVSDSEDTQYYDSSS